MKEEILYKVIYCKNRYSTMILIFNVVPYHVLHTTSKVQRRHKFLGRKCVLIAVPASHALPPLPPYLTWSDVSVESCRGQGSENRSVSIQVNMADGVKPPILNSKYVSRCDRLYEVRRCHAADTGHNDTKPWHFLQIPGWSWYRTTLLYLHRFYLAF
jgi:hypothetical protein